MSTITHPAPAGVDLDAVLFGVLWPDDPAERISTRDALERAQALHDDGQAYRLLALAVGARDDVLAAAVARRALRSGWATTTESWLRQHPHLRATAERLAALRDTTQTTTGAPR